MLELYQVWLIVNIRRNIDKALNFEKLSSLWRHEDAFLLENLSTRWLISVCDTVVDCSENKHDVMVAMSATLFMNTIKLYETERMAQLQSRPEGDMVHPLPSGTALFDGMTGYMEKGGDMVHNLSHRLFQAVETDRWVGKIYLNLFKRAHEYDTVYKRMAEANENLTVKWWSDGKFLIKKT